MAKELHRYWFSGGCGSTIGIIKCQDQITDEIKYYIGAAYGIDPDIDAQHIMKYGDKFNLLIFDEYKMLVNQYKKLLKQNMELQKQLKGSEENERN